MRKSAHFFSVLGSSLFALSGVGCGPAMPEDLLGGAGAGSEEPVGSTTLAGNILQCKYENLKFYSVNTPNRWRIGTGTPSNTVCWLTNIAGQAINSKPDMSVTSDANGWYVTGNNNDVKAACAPLNCFHSGGGAQDVTWASETYTAGSPDATNRAPMAGGSCASGTTVGWMADSAIMFQGIEFFSGSSWGSMVTTKDAAKTAQPESSRQYTSATFTDCYDDGQKLKMFASNLFVGIPGGIHRPVFMGPLATHSYGITGAGEYVAKSWDSSHYTEMRYLDEGICYLASVAGALKTAADGAEIFPVYYQSMNRWRWVLRAEKLSGDNNSYSGVKATARCYKYKQAQ